MPKSEDFSVVMLSFNEEDNITILVDLFKDIDDVVLVDGGSTDKTIELATAAGWNVITDRPFFGETVSKNDVRSFKKLFGFEPTFKVGQKIPNSAQLREWAATHAKNDFILFNDCDEHPTFFDIDAIRKILPNIDCLRYPFIHEHDKNGEASVQFVNSKFYRRSIYKWSGRIHEVVISTIHNPRIEYTEILKIDHWQRMDREYRASGSSIVEFDALKCQVPRQLYYVARQYAAELNHEKAIRAFPIYLKCSAGDGQRAQAYLYMAWSYSALKEPRKSIESLHLSMIEDPYRRDAFYALARTYYDLEDWQQAITWFEAALTIPMNPDAFYVVNNLYGENIHLYLSKCYYELGIKEKAEYHASQGASFLQEQLAATQV
jgi:tetratricopeptide (TPR) repeat protein